MRVSRWAAVALAIAFVATGCGSREIGSIGGDSLEDSRAAGCDSGELVEVLAPGSTFDYNPSKSPADLAASTEVVFRAGVVSSIELGQEWTTVAVDQVRVIQDHRDQPAPIKTFGAFGTGIEDRPAVDPATLDGMVALVFAHESTDAPGHLVAAIEGLWLQCPGEQPLSVVATPASEAWHQAATSIDAIAAAVGGKTPVGEVAITSKEGEGWHLVSNEPGFGRGHEVAIVTSERELDRAAAGRWFGTRPEADFESEVVIILAPAVSGSCPAIVFDGLTITDDRVFGRFEPGPPPAGTDTCTDDANPVSFVLVVQRHVLPDAFTLSVEREVVCRSCERAQIKVDLR